LCLEILESNAQSAAAIAGGYGVRAPSAWKASPVPPMISHSGKKAYASE
jgi:hypothetical protein